jgi:hypothetical protein
LDGFSVVTGILIVRLASSDAKLQIVFQQHRSACFAALAGVLGMAGLSYGGMFVQLARDGRLVDSEYFLNAAASEDETAVLKEFRKVGHEEDLVLAPESLAMLLLETPMHSFASHQHLSLDYYREQAEAGRFFDHKMTSAEAAAMLERYGIHWVVVPRESKAGEYFAGVPASFERGGMRVFEIPGNEMKAYPGLAVIDPEGLHRMGFIRQVLRVVK